MMIYGFRERESILEFFEKTTGLRMNHNFIRPGGVAADLPPGWKDDVGAILKDLPHRLVQYDDLLKENPIWLLRTKGVGIISAEEAIAYSITGPPLRAAGVDWDLRKVFPYSGIEQYEFDVPLGENGDVYDRYRIKVEEITESLKIVEQVMDAMPKGDYRVDDRKITPPPRARIDESMEALIHHFKLFTEGFKVPAGESYVAVESPPRRAWVLSGFRRWGHPLSDAHPRSVVLQPPGPTHRDGGQLDGRRGRHHRIDGSGDGRR